VCARACVCVRLQDAESDREAAGSKLRRLSAKLCRRVGLLGLRRLHSFVVADSPVCQSSVDGGSGPRRRPASATPGSDRPLTLLIYTRPASPRRLTRRQAVDVPSWGRGGQAPPPKSWLAPTKFSRSLLLTHSGQLILGKNSKFDATRRQILRQTAGGELTALLQTTSCFKGEKFIYHVRTQQIHIQVRQW